MPAPDNIIPDGSKVTKLAPNFLRKDHYVCHVRNLHLSAKLGVVVDKIHRGVSFDESTFLAPYVRKNTELRMQAKSSFEKDFFKLLNNSVFGKSCENSFNTVDLRLIDGNIKLTAKPTYKHHTIYDDSLVGIHSRRDDIQGEA